MGLGVEGIGIGVMFDIKIIGIKVGVGEIWVVEILVRVEEELVDIGVLE